MGAHRALMEDAVRNLAAIERGSASPGEREAAEWIAARLRELGCEARVEPESAHGGFWGPLGLANGLAAAAGALFLRRGRHGKRARALAAAGGALGAAAIWDDVSGGRLWFRRALLPHRTTWNVVAEAGDPAADRTLLLVAHHDAAHSGLVFHPALPRVVAERFPGAIERGDRSFPVMYLVWLGPLVVALGALLGRRRPVAAGATLAAGAAAAMLDIGLRRVVPGANDNLTAVAALLAVAAELRERPPGGLRVLLVSTGSEESFSEGMHGFVRRHRSALPPERTELLCLECLGAPTLHVLEGEGMLRMRDYDPELRDELMRAADAAGTPIERGWRTIAATDALVALRRGYRAATLTSLTPWRFPINYHWPTDVPDGLDWDTLERAVEVTLAFLRRRALSGAPAGDGRAPARSRARASTRPAPAAAGRSAPGGPGPAA